MTEVRDDLKDRMAGIMADARYMVGNPSAWDSYDDGASEVIRGLVARIEELEREVARCHERLEIDHYWKIGDNDDQDLERVEIPTAERADFPDGISARDATIALLEEDRAAAVLAEREAILAMLAVDGPHSPRRYIYDTKPDRRIWAMDKLEAAIRSRGRDGG